MIRYRVTFEGDGNGELPKPDYVFRDDALTVGETMVYGPGHWRVMEVKTVPGDDAQVVVVRRIRLSE